MDRPNFLLCYFYKENSLRVIFSAMVSRVSS